MGSEGETMPAYFNEDNTIEQMVVKTLSDNGWKYIPAEQHERAVFHKNHVVQYIFDVGYQMRG